MVYWWNVWESSQNWVVVSSIFLFSSRTLGKMKPFWRAAYFSNGLVQGISKSLWYRSLGTKWSWGSLGHYLLALKSSTFAYSRLLVRFRSEGSGCETWTIRVTLWVSPVRSWHLEFQMDHGLVSQASDFTISRKLSPQWMSNAWMKGWFSIKNQPCFCCGSSRIRCDPTLHWTLFTSGLRLRLPDPGVRQLAASYCFWAVWSLTRCYFLFLLAQFR